LIREYPWISANTGGVLVAYVLNVLFALNKAMLFVWIFSTCVLSKTFINSSIKDLLQNMGDNFTADEVSSIWCCKKDIAQHKMRYYNI
jgi:ABC-type iron transport system FetAB permease component